jgi:hypothetical protein
MLHLHTLPTRSIEKTGSKLTKLQLDRARRLLLESKPNPRALLALLAREKTPFIGFVKEFVYFLFKEGVSDAQVFFDQRTKAYINAYQKMYRDYVVNSRGKELLELHLGIELNVEQYDQIRSAIIRFAYRV